MTQTETPPITSAPLPPAVPGVPVVGNLIDLRRDQINFFLQSQRQYGDIIRLKIVSRWLYLVSDPDAIKHILQDNNRNYIKGRGVRKLKPALGDGLLTSEGDFWRRQRRLAQPAFHRRQIESFAETMTTTTNARLAEWDTAVTDQMPLNISDQMMRLTLDIVTRTLFSTALTSEEFDTVASTMPHFLHHANTRITRPFDFIDELPLPDNRQFLADRDTLDAIIYRIIRERRQSGEQKTDLLGMLMSAVDEETGESMSDEHLRDEATTIFLAGHETTANLLAWTLMLLAQHPDSHQRLIAEVDAVLGKRTPTAADVGDLVYTNQVLHEALRLYPPAWIFGRAALADDVVGGYHIPADSEVLMSPYVVHRHPAYWPNPETFDPERFAAGWERDLPRYAFVPFGGGPRLCIGNNFALMEAALILAMIVQRYELNLLPGSRPQPEAAVTMRPKGGLWMTAVERNRG